jgi:hypothetical protein
METNNSTAGTLSVFDILEALTGELPCYASPNWKEDDQPMENPSTVLGKVKLRENQNEQALAAGLNECMPQYNQKHK